MMRLENGILSIFPCDNAYTEGITLESFLSSILTTKQEQDNNDFKIVSKIEISCVSISKSVFIALTNFLQAIAKQQNQQQQLQSICISSCSGPFVLPLFEYCCCNHVDFYLSIPNVQFVNYNGVIGLSELLQAATAATTTTTTTTTKITRDGVNTSLQSLAITQCFQSNNNMKLSLKSSPPFSFPIMSALHTLKFNGSSFSLPTCIDELISFLKHCPNLKRLELKCCQLSDDESSRILQAIQEYCPKLQCLDLFDNVIQNKSIWTLSQLMQQKQSDKLFGHLQELNLSHPSSISTKNHVAATINNNNENDDDNNNIDKLNWNCLWQSIAASSSSSHSSLSSSLVTLKLAGLKWNNQDLDSFCNQYFNSTTTARPTPPCLKHLDLSLNFITGITTLCTNVLSRRPNYSSSIQTLNIKNNPIQSLQPLIQVLQQSNVSLFHVYWNVTIFEILYWTTLNQGGRRSIMMMHYNDNNNNNDDNHVTPFPFGLWSFVLARVTTNTKNTSSTTSRANQRCNKSTTLYSNNNINMTSCNNNNNNNNIITQHDILRYLLMGPVLLHQRGFNTTG